MTSPTMPIGRDFTVTNENKPPIIADKAITVKPFFFHDRSIKVPITLIMQNTPEIIDGTTKSSG